MKCQRLPFLVAVAVAALAAVVPAHAQDKKGANYAFLVACKQYIQSEFPTLPYTIKEMAEFQKTLESSGFEAKNVKFLHDEQSETRQRPLKRAVVKELDLLIERLKPEDMLIVAISGHGLHFKGDKVSYFQPIDAEFDDKTSMIPMEGEGGLIPRLERCKAGRKLLLVNACRNDPRDFGQAAQKVQLDDEDTDTKAAGIATIYACNPGQRSFYYPPKKDYPKSPGLERSLFFHHVIESWRGAYSTTGAITLDQVIGDVEKRVAADADAILGVKQQPLVKRKYEGKWVVNDNVVKPGAAVTPLLVPVRVDADAEAKAIKWVAERGGGLIRDPDRKDEPVVAIRGLNCRQIKQADLQHLTAFPFLEKLDAVDLHLGEFQVRHLAALPALKSLSLKNPKCTEAGAAELSKLPNLRQLDVEHERPTAADVAALAPLRAMTSYFLILDREDTAKTMEAVSQLRQVTKLRIYDRFHTISDGDLASLAKLPAVTQLDLNFSGFDGVVEKGNQGLTAAGYNHLKSMTTVKSLSLRLDGFQPAEHIRLLAKFTHLEKLDLTVKHFADLLRAQAYNQYEAAKSVGDEEYREKARLDYNARLATALKYDLSSEIEALKKAFPKNEGSVRYERIKP